MDTLKTVVNNCCGTSLIVGDDNGEHMPTLGQNFPNPFDDNTTIEYYLPNDVQGAYMEIVDISGALVQTINIGARGHGHVIVATGSMAPGTYFYTLYADNDVVGTKQMLISLTV